MMAAILVVLGAISFSRLGLDFFPDLEFPTVSVITTYSGASSEDIENVLTRPLEQVVSSVNRVKKVTSQTSEGVSVISVEFEWGTNLDFAAQDIRDQIGLYEQYLPGGGRRAAGHEVQLQPVPGHLLRHHRRPAAHAGCKTIVEDEVAPRLERIDGVASARSSPWTSARSWSTSTRARPESRAA
ncbi:MAG: efflux RND transporter permease subunit [Marinilabiliales bacterium]|nr:efflux RND transporter permease subunit [Marinilabiliales bacterium]